MISLHVTRAVYHRVSSSLVVCNRGTNIGRRTQPVTLPGPRHRYLSSNTAPVELSYTCVTPPNGNTTSGAVVILHGLFGSKRNFASLAKAFMQDLNLPIYSLDLRNHGSSPHAAKMTYEIMARDIHHFIKDKGLKDVSLLGHSMGGKVAMTLALSPSPPNISNLIILDVAPTQSVIRPSVRYLDAMSHIEDPANNVRTREDAERILEGIENDSARRQFILTNLVLPDSAADPSRATVKFQVPVPLIKAAIPDLAGFPFSTKDGNKWLGRTLVVKGAKSQHINETNVPLLDKFFPNMQLKVLNTGHWVHAEKPDEFRKIFVDFILRK